MRKSLLLAALMLLLSPSFAKADITLGVLANRGELKAKEEYSELAAQLTKDLGTNVTLLPLSIDQAADSLDNKKADLLLSNPVIAALTVEKVQGAACRHGHRQWWFRVRRRHHFKQGCGHHDVRPAEGQKSHVLWHGFGWGLYLSGLSSEAKGDRRSQGSGFVCSGEKAG